MTIQKTSHTCWICGKKTREWTEKKGMYYCPDCKDDKKCPDCGFKMRPSVKLEFKNPATMRKKTVQVYDCSRCGYKILE
jgi:DNA-directed RNA polymerase subunit RPC12/RpoP